MLISSEQFLAERSQRHISAQEAEKQAQKERDLERDKLDQLENDAGGVSAGRGSPHCGCH